jgi:broad specificity phosphatase PhoE
MVRKKIISAALKMSALEPKHEQAEHLAECEAAKSSYAMKSKLIKVLAQVEDDSAPLTVYETENDESKVRVKRVYFVRHGQGFHNKVAAESVTKCDCKDAQVRSGSAPSRCPYRDDSLLDPLLTELGVEQAKQAGQSIGGGERVQLVAVSPLRRATETALIAFDAVVSDERVRFVALECCREQWGQHKCDRRLSAEALRKQYGERGVDYSLLESDEDPLWLDDVREARSSVAARCEQSLRWIAERNETHVALASHSSYMLTMFNVILDCSAAPSARRWFETGELRVLDLAIEL